MEQLNEISRIGVQIGEDFEGEGKRYVKVNLTINEQAAQQQIQKLNALCQNNLESEWGVILSLSVNPSNKQKLVDLIEKLTKQDSDGSSDIHQALREQLEEGIIQIKYIEHEGKILVSISPQGDMLNEVKEPFNQFYNSGLKELAQTQSNSLSFSLTSNISNEDFMQLLESGERIASALLQPSRIEIDASIHKDLGSKFKEMAQGFDPSLAKSPPIIFLKYFKNLDLDLRFESSSELPEFIRKNVLFGKELQKCSPADRKLKETMDSCLNVILDTLDADIDVYFTIPDFLSVHATGHSPAMSTLIKEYGGFIVGF